MCMKRNDAQFQEMVSRISSGELTRAQAAEVYQVKPGTLGVWLARSGVYSKSPDGPKKLHGAAVKWADTDPDKAKAYEEAVMMVLKGMPGAEAARKYNVNYQYLMRKAASAQRLMEEAEAKHKNTVGIKSEFKSSYIANIRGEGFHNVTLSDSRAVGVLSHTLEDGFRSRLDLAEASASNPQDKEAIDEAIRKWDLARDRVYFAARELVIARKALSEQQIRLTLGQLNATEEQAGQGANMQPSKEDAEGMAKSRAAALEALAEADAQEGKPKSGPYNLSTRFYGE